MWRDKHLCNYCVLQTVRLYCLFHNYREQNVLNFVKCPQEAEDGLSIESAIPNLPTAHCKHNKRTQ